MASFRTVAGRPVTAVTADEMREVDRVAVEEGGLELLQMMENAGRTLAANALALLAGVDRGPAVVLAGGGGNGGGGLCAARHLHNHGVAVRVVLDRDPGELRDAASTQFAILDAAGVPARAAGDDRDRPDLEDATLVADALVGYGLTDAPRGPTADLIEAAAGTRVLSLDVPSGYDATTGGTPGVAVEPERTVTLALPKTGLAEVPGGLTLADIGIPPAVYERAGISYESPFDGEWWIELARSS